MRKTVDVVILGAGIAGLWTYARLRRAGYDALLCEHCTIGGGQTIAAQGIIHSGLKYALAGRVNDTARAIMAMPERWRAALRGEGEVDLSAARVRAESQLLLMPRGLMGGLKSLVAQRALTRSRELAPSEWPGDLRRAGFAGTVVFMDELVVDVPSVLRALAEPWRDGIRSLSRDEGRAPMDCLRDHGIEPRILVLTAAEGNVRHAAGAGDGDEIGDQRRPLVQGLLKPAPFPLFAHLAGGSMTDKPLATITTHETATGEPVWYIGAAVAERPMDTDPREVVAAARGAIADYLPGVDLSAVQWATLPVDRVEGRTRGLRMPDAPTLRRCGDVLYGWPTKLTFAPMLADMVMSELQAGGVRPSGRSTDFSFLPPAGYAAAPWDCTTWTS